MKCDNEEMRITSSSNFITSLAGLGFTIAAFLLLTPSVQADAWQNRRAQMRDQRNDLRNAADEDRQARAATARQAIATLVDEVEAGKVQVQTEAIWQLLAGLGRLSEAHLGDLPERVRSLDVADESDTAGQQTLARVHKTVTQRPWDLLQRAVRLGHVSLACDFMWEILFFDPDFEPIRKTLGQRKVNTDRVKGLPLAAVIDGPLARRMPEVRALHPNRYWFSRFDAARLQQGLWWDSRFGWIVAEHYDRYERGYVFDLQRKQWTSLAEANAFHAKHGEDWVIRTEHLLIHGTADLQTLATVADHLESLYDEIFRAFPGFFSHSRRMDALQLALGLAEHEPLEIWVYRDRQEYLQRADAVAWSGGIFRPTDNTAHFYGRPTTVMYHEFTHQVLHVLTSRNRSPSWLTEGIAMYTETVTFGIHGAQFRGGQPEGSWSVEELLRLRDGKDWYRAVETAERENRRSPYGASGSLVTFCMNAFDGRLKADFVDYLRDSYRGQTQGRQVWDYMGLSEADFIPAYQKWGRDVLADNER